MMYFSKWLSLVPFAVLIEAKCYEPNPAFPVPTWPQEASSLRPAFDILEGNYDDLVKDARFENTSFSIEVTSKTDTLWGYYHTAINLNETRPGDKHVDKDSQYRIASISKTFTVLAILYQHEAGNLSLDAPVTNYIAELNSSEYILPWKDITIRILASQLSGIPREFAQSDIWNGITDPTRLGLPPATAEGLPSCDEYNYYKPCNRSDLLEQLKKDGPVFAPNQKSTYSNLNYELLGLVLENVTGLAYKNYIAQAIFEPLGMANSSLNKPGDKKAVLPVMPDGEHYWDVNEGIQNPTGGIYTSASDMSTYLRYVLTHYNTIATGVNWFLPASWSTGLSSFYGTPWETFRTSTLLPHTQRPVTYVTKSGGLPGYYSHIYLLEEYGLGITLLVGGSDAVFGDLHNLVTVDLVRAAEEQIWKDIDEEYSGTYLPTSEFAHLNSSVVLQTSPSKGLHVETFISNGTDVLTALFSASSGHGQGSFFSQHLTDSSTASSSNLHYQLTPTYLFADESNQAGEIWRILPVSSRDPQDGVEKRVWDEFCPTDVDTMSYAGRAVNEIIFWEGKEGSTIELPAWKVMMRMVKKSEEGMVVHKEDL